MVRFFKIEEAPILQCFLPNFKMVYEIQTAGLIDVKNLIMEIRKSSL